MVDGGFLALVVVATLASAFMAWAVGAVAIGGAPFAPAVGVKAIPTMRAAFLLGVVGFVGAVLQGAAVAETIGGGVVAGVQPSPLAASLAVLLAAGLMAVGVLFDYPIPAAFTVTGAIAGAGFALGGEPLWDLYLRFAVLWIVAPVLMLGVAYVVALVLENDRIDPDRSLAAVTAGVVVSLVVLEFSFLTDEGTRSLLGVVTDVGWIPFAAAAVVVPLAGATAGWYAAVQSIDRRGVARTQQVLLVSLGVLVAFAGGGNQIGLAAGPLLPLVEGTVVSRTAVIVGASVLLVVGAWTGAPRLIEAIAHEYATLSPERAIAALLPAFLVAQAGVQSGVPISFNQIIIATIVGSALAAGKDAAVGKRKLALTTAAWALSLVLAVAVSYAVVAVAL